MASLNVRIVRAALATATAALLAILFPLFILPFLPPLQPLAVQILYRLREALAFLAFTTAIAIGIFKSQRKEAGRKKPSLEFHPLPSIFGEPDYGEAEVYTEAAGEGQQQQRKKNSLALCREDGEGGGGEDDEHGNAVDLVHGNASGGLNGALLQEKKQEAMAASRRRSLPASKEEGSLDVESKVASAGQRKLHRRTSSLDGSINYEPEPEANAGKAVLESPPINKGHTITPSTKSSKRVSFSMDSSSDPTSHRDKQKQDIHGEKQTRAIHGAQQQNITTAMSPNELTRQADAFIAKFKEQMRMQQQESFQRQRRQVP